MDNGSFKPLVIGAGLAILLTLGACGGGGDPPVPVVEVVTVKKAIGLWFDTPTQREIEQVAVQVKILGVRCASVSPPLSNRATIGAQLFTLVLDLAAADVEKTKVYGFSVFTAAEQARGSPVPCN